jgi:hypothetical protein
VWTYPKLARGPVVARPAAAAARGAVALARVAALRRAVRSLVGPRLVEPRGAAGARRHVAVPEPPVACTYGGGGGGRQARERAHPSTSKAAGESIAARTRVHLLATAHVAFYFRKACCLRTLPVEAGALEIVVVAAAVAVPVALVQLRPAARNPKPQVQRQPSRRRVPVRLLQVLDHLGNTNTRWVEAARHLLLVF